MDFHDDHTAFDTATSTDEVSHMYVPHGDDDHGLGDDGTTGAGGHGGDDSDGTTITVNTGGQEVTADATIDIDHDGHNDTAIVQDTQGDHIAVTDTDGDGEADHAALLDESGHVVETAHVGAGGTWVQDGPSDSNPYGGPGASIEGGGSGGSDPTTPGDGGSTSGGSSGSSNTIVIDSGGQTTDAQATVDSDHDGHNDTAVVRTADGNQVAFTDSDGDGHADQAVVYSPDGHLIGTAHYDEATGTWVEGAGDGSQAGTSTAGAGAAGGIGAGSGGSEGGDATADGSHPAGGAGSGNSEQVEVTVGGQTTEVAASYDLNNDGHDETAIVQGPDGTRIAFSDTDGDGDADKAAVYDAAGKLVGTATYNEGSGTWVQDN
jgi:hypothetical protein